jgi:hypothetical protein
MAFNRPLFYDQTSKAFRQMSDTQMEILSYAVRKKYSQYLDNSLLPNVGGKISAGGAASGYSIIGLLQNTITLDVTQTRTDDNVPPTGDGDFPATLSSASHVEATQDYSYRQYNGTSAPTFNTRETDGYLTWNYTLKGVQVETDLTNIFDTIISDVIYEIQYGDRVGGYAVGKTQPVDGGIWVDKGLIFSDTSYYNAQEDFHIFIKMADFNEDTILYSNPNLAKKYTTFVDFANGNSNFIQKDSNNFDIELVINVLLQILMNRYPKYNFNHISGTDSTTNSSTIISNYSGTNYGFITERFVYSGYSLDSVVNTYGGSYFYRAKFTPDNNSYRYNVWALTPNGNA